MRNGKINNHKGIKYGDTKSYKIFKFCLFIWVIIFLITLSLDFKIFGIEVDRIWLGLLLFLILMFITYVLIAIALYQIKKHFPDFFDKFPERIKKYR